MRLARSLKNEVTKGHKLNAKPPKHTACPNSSYKVYDSLFYIKLYELKGVKAIKKI